MKLKGSEYFYFKNLDQMPRVLKPSGNEMIVRIPISLVIKWPTMYRWVFSRWELSGRHPVSYWSNARPRMAEGKWPTVYSWLFAFPTVHVNGRLY